MLLWGVSSDICKGFKGVLLVSLNECESCLAVERWKHVGAVNGQEHV